MEDITDFLIQKGYKIEYKTINPKGRGKFQYSCIIDKKPIDCDIEELQKKLGVTILNNNFKKGTELSMLIKKNEDTDKQIEVVDINLDDVSEMIYKKELSRKELRYILNMFQSSCYTKGYNAHKNAIKKLLNSL